MLPRHLQITVPPERAIWCRILTTGFSDCGGMGFLSDVVSADAPRSLSVSAGKHNVWRRDKSETEAGQGGAVLAMTEKPDAPL